MSTRVLLTPVSLCCSWQQGRRKQGKTCITWIGIFFDAQALHRPRAGWPFRL